MKERKTIRTGLAYGILAAALLSGSCSKKDNPDQGRKVTVTYALSNVGGAYPSQTTYIQGLADLDITSLDNSRAAEIASFSSQWTYNGAVYLTAFGAPATINKYTFDAAGKAVAAGKLMAPGANTFSSIEFVSNTEAYASVGGGLAKVIRFDPSSLRITGEIDLSAIVNPGAKSIYYLGMKAREGKLFMGVNYFDADFNPYDTAYVAVIDLALGKVEKLIKDKRTANIFLAGSSVSGFALAANGDLYIQGLGTTNAPSGILRIKKGATDFDPAYFFDLKAATGKNCSGLYLFDNGLAFTTQMQDPSDAYETKGPNYRYYKIDISGRKSLGDMASSLPNIYGASTSIMRRFDDHNLIWFVVSGAAENSIYTYSINDGKVAKKITMTGGTCTGFDQLR